MTFDISGSVLQVNELYMDIPKRGLAFGRQIVQSLPVFSKPSRRMVFR